MARSKPLTAHQTRFKSAAKHCVLNRGKQKYPACMKQQLGGLSGAKRKRRRRSRR